MLVTSTHSSTQRPLGLSVEELYALDRQYRRIEQQQQHLQTQTRLASSNLNRLASRSLDLVSSTAATPLTVLPALQIHGQGYSNQPQTPLPSNYPRSHSIDQFRYTPAVLTTTALPSPHKPSYPQRSSPNDAVHPQYHSRYRTYLQAPTMANGPTSTVGNNFMYNNNPSSSTEYYDARNSCKLRRQQPVKRELSRRIIVRPLVQRRREPSISSSCESLDEQRSPGHRLPIEQSNLSNPPSISFTPSASLITNVIENLDDVTDHPVRAPSNTDSLSDDNEVNLYEMRVPIGKTYDTSDISVQLEGPKILIHCHTIEPTDKRGNYRKHEFKTELLVPDVVHDETIVAYLTEDGQLIVEGKYHSWAWKEMKQKRKLEQQELNISASPILLPPFPMISSETSVNAASTSTRTDGGLEKERIPMSSLSNQSPRIISPNHQSSANRIEKLDNNRTVIHVGEPTTSTDAKNVTDMITRFNTLHTTYTSTISDGQYTFTNDSPPLLLYHVRLPLDASMESVRIQPDPYANILKVHTEPQERPSSNRLTIRSIPRICRLPRDFTYDYTHLRVIFLRDNFIRIEVPTFN